MIVSFFIGAGMSAAYGMPTASSFMEQLKNRGRDRRRWRAVADMLDASTMEELFDGLAGAAGRAAAGMRRTAPPLSTPDMDRRMRMLGGAGNLANALRKRVFEEYTLDPGKRELLAAVLGPLLDLAGGQAEVPVYTTNYDRCVEECCADVPERFVCHDGFRRDRLTGRTRWTGGYGRRSGAAGAGEPKVLNLYKLHGSLDWKLGPYGPERIDGRILSAGARHDDLMVYPSSREDPLKGADPFKAVFSKFRESILSSDACIAVGYSFRDGDIARVFEEYARTGRTLALVGDNAAPDFYRRVLRAGMPADEARRWGRSGPGRAVRLNLPPPLDVHAVNGMAGSKTMLRITGAIGNVLRAARGRAAAP